MTRFRTLRNGDLPQLVAVFKQHHELAGSMPDISIAQFEQAILARSFFDPKNFLVATHRDSHENEVIVGWCHFGPKLDSKLSPGDQEPLEIVIAAICLTKECQASVAVELLDETVRLARQLGKNTASAGGPEIQGAPELQGNSGLPGDSSVGPVVMKAGLFRDDYFGYAGLVPYSHGYGVENLDVRLHGVLQACGFVADRSLVRLVASTDGYRPAFSREAMQFRRSATVHQKRILPDTVRRAAALSHLDIERHALVDRSGGVIGGMDFWFSDAEAQVMSPSKAIMDLDLDAEAVLSASDSYLVSAVVGNLADRNIRQVEAVVDSSQVELINQLGKISFTVASEGTVWKLR